MRGRRGPPRSGRRDARPAAAGRRGSRAGTAGRSVASIHAAPSRASISPGVRSGGITWRSSATLTANRDRPRRPARRRAACRGRCRTGTRRPGPAARFPGRRTPACRAARGRRPRWCRAAGRSRPAAARRGCPGRWPARRPGCRRRAAAARGRDDPFAEDGRLGGPLADRVELLQRVDQRGERVAAEPALRWPDPGHDRLAGGRVGPAGAAQREPVQRPVGGEVAVVAAVQFGAQRGRSRACPRRRRPRRPAGPARCPAARAVRAARRPGCAGTGMRLVQRRRRRWVNVPSARARRYPSGCGGPRSFGLPPDGVPSRRSAGGQVRPRCRAEAISASRAAVSAAIGVAGRA